MASGRGVAARASGGPKNDRSPLKRPLASLLSLVIATAAETLQKPQALRKGRPFQPEIPATPKGFSKNKVKPLEKPKRKATGKPLSPVIATAAEISAAEAQARAEGRPFQPGNPHGRPSDQKTRPGFRWRSPSERPLASLLSPVIATAAGRKARSEQVQSRSEGGLSARGEWPLAASEGLAGYPKKQALLENPSPFMTGPSKLLPMMLRELDAPLIVERVYYTGRGLKPMCKPVVQ